jgi:hypothetical protein
MPVPIVDERTEIFRQRQRNRAVHDCISSLASQRARRIDARRAERGNFGGDKRRNREHSRGRDVRDGIGRTHVKQLSAKRAARRK